MSSPPKLGQAQKATIAAFLCLVLVIGISVGQSSRQPPSEQRPAGTTQNNGSVQTAEKPPNITDWLLVLFSGLLVVSNVFLWRANNRSASIAEQSAENAERALQSLEIPHVFPVELKFSVFEDPHGAPLIATVSASLKNFGRSPAFLKELYLIVAVTNLVRRAGDRPLYHSGRIPFMAEDVIGDKETIGPFEKSVPELLPYCSRIKDGSLQLGLLVNHRIDDALKDTFGRGAWYVWNPKRKKFVAGVQLWTEN
jgi:hypothetical protein